jgi:hypothetical protein
MNTAIRYLAGCGLQTAALAFGGLGSGIPTQTEEYDGSSWTTGATLNIARLRLGGAGTQTAGLGFGGQAPPDKNATEEYTGGGPATFTVGSS